MLLPQSTIAPTSGPVLPSGLNNVWGTSLGVLVSWEPFDFGLRKASVDAAEVSRQRAGAEAAVARLEVGTASADAFLTLLAAPQTVLAAKAGVDRAQVLARTVDALVQAELRPGAESSRAKAEPALAETQLIRAEQAVDEARAALAQFLGAAPAGIRVTPGPLLKEAPLPEPGPPSPAAAAHPQAAARNAAVDEVKARERVLDRSYFPRFHLQATTYGRGTGVEPSGVTGGAASGLGPNTGNWGLGMTVTFPALELPSLRAKKQLEAALERSEAARYRLVLQEIDGNVERAKAVLNGARRVERIAPVQLEAARAAEQQAGARYKAGLGAIVEVAEAQRLLTQAEIDESLARLGVWRAMLAVASAEGDLSPFLEKARE